MNEPHPPSAELTVVCHVRASLVLDPVDAKIETLRTCESEGRIDSLLLRSWPGEVPLVDGNPNQEVVDRFERFDRWADAHGVSVRPPFRIRTSTSLASDEPTSVLVTPVCCLALYHDDRLVGVYPHSDGETTFTATEAVAALRTDEGSNLPARPAPSEADATAGSRDAAPGAERSAAPPRRNRSSPAVCPSCGEPLVNVQGILACTGCRWDDTGLDAVTSPQAKLVYLSLQGGPASVDALQAALDIRKVTLYGLLRTLSKRGHVERTDSGAYRTCRQDGSRGDRPRPVRPD